MWAVEKMWVEIQVVAWVRVYKPMNERVGYLYNCMVWVMKNKYMLGGGIMEKMK